MNDKKLGCTEKEKPNACNAIKVFVDLLKFIHIHRSVPSERQKIKFNETILEKIQYSIFAKAKPSKKNKITQESIIKNIGKCQECFDLWPESYKKRIGNDQGKKTKGESIFKELENAVDILRTYKTYLQSQSVRMSSISNSLSGATAGELNCTKVIVTNK